MNEKDLAKQISGRKEYVFITYLRILGMVLVAWPHLTAAYQPEWPILRAVQWLFTRPLYIIQNFGQVGVSIFYLISGFLMAQNERTGISYLKRRISRILLPILPSMGLFFLFQYLMTALFHLPSKWGQFTLLQWLQSASLWNYLWWLQDDVNGVLWYLFPLLCLDIIYAFCNLFKKMSPVLVIIVADLWILAAAFIMPKLTWMPPGLLNWAPFIAIPLFGIIIFLYYDKRLSRKQTVTLGLFNYVVLVIGFYSRYNIYYETTPYIISTVYAAFVFVVFLAMEHREWKKETYTPRGGG